MYSPGFPEGKGRALRSSARIIAVALLAWLLVPESSATHFRFGTLNWQPTDTRGEVVFQLVNSFRRDGYAGTFSDGGPQIGDVITEIVGATTFFFGDGQTTSTLQYRVTAFSAEENWIVGEALQPGTTLAGLRHTYAGAGPYVNVGINSCCRLSTLNNRFEDNYILDGRVTPLDGNRSAVTALVPIVSVGSSSAATFQVAATDPDGDRLRWRLSTSAEAGGGAHPPGMTVDPNTGWVTWNNIGLDTVNFWTAQVIVEDLDGNGRVKSKTPIDFLLQITGDPPGSAPICTVSPPGPFDVAVNTPISFTVTGTDLDKDAVVTLNSGGLPNGASTSPSLPTSGPSGVRVTFNWTPTAPGTHQVVFSATDNTGQQQLCPVSIIVREAADLSIGKVATPETVKVSSNLTYLISVTNNGPSSASDVTMIDTLPEGVTFVSANSSQGSCVQAAGVVTCTLGALTSGSFASMAVVITATNAGSITNVARVTGSPGDPNLADNEATVVSVVQSTNAAPIADASASDLVVISGNNVDAAVRLDGSRSSDPDADALTYSWLEGAAPLATGVTADVTLSIGSHSIDLIVSDGVTSDTDTIQVVILSLCDAINLLKIEIDEAVLARRNKRPLFAIIEEGCQAFDAGHFQAGVNQLRAFQNKVRAQVEPLDPVAAQRFHDLAQEIIDAVEAAPPAP
jgi:uncharacterized repeat protein (TIGR01451 family)